MLFSLLTALQSIILYILVIVPAEYFLTEHYHVYKFITSQKKTLIFIILFILVFLVNYFLIKAEKYWWLIILIFILSLFGYEKYQQFHIKQERVPDIYSISSDWTIQGKKITIKGKDFGDPHDQSNVIVGDIQFMIHKWTQQEIVASQPITDDYGKKSLYVIRHNGKRSEPFSFEIRDPAGLVN